MQNMILMLFGIFFSLGIFLVLAYFFKVPTLKSTKAVINIGKVKKKKAKNSDAFIMDISIKLSKYIPIDSVKKRKITSTLKSAEIPMTAEVYLAQCYVKTAMILLITIPCLFIVPIVSPVFVIMAIGVFFSESSKADKIVKIKRDEIEYELPRMVATLTQAFSASRDLRTILESYNKGAGPAMKSELSITIADMATGNYEEALTRFETRISSGLLSEVVSGLRTVLAGNDGVVYFRLIAQNMKMLEINRLKMLAKERPPKIRKYSFMLLGCMLILYMGVMGYQILGAMSGL